MKRKQTLLVMMTALFCVLGVDKLWAQAQDLDSSYFAANVKVQSVEKKLPAKTKLPVTTEVYFDVKLADTGTGAKWTITGNSYDVSATGERPHLLLKMPLMGDSILPDGSTSETQTAVAYYAGSGDTADTLRFIYKVRPGDISTDITWDLEDGGLALGGDLGGITISAIDPVDGAGKVKLVKSVLQGNVDDPDTDAAVPVSGYTITLGDGSDNPNRGKLYEGLVPVTVKTIKPESGVHTVVPSEYACYLWAEDTNGNYYNVGVTSLNSRAGEQAKIIEAGAPTAGTAFPANYAAELSGMDQVAFTEQKFFVNVPKGLPGTKVRLCYGIYSDDPDVKSVYAYTDYDVIATPVPAVAKGYTVRSVNLEPGDTLTLPGAEMKYTNLNGVPVDGIIELGAGESTLVTIAKKGEEDLADKGTLYASIEMVSAANNASAKFERYYVPIDAYDGDYKVNLSVGEVDASGATYFRIRVPGLEDANGAGTEDKPYYLMVKALPKRESITLLASATTDGTGIEYYQPKDATAGQTPGSFNVLEYTLSVKASDDPRYFLIYPTDATGKYRVDSNATVAGLTYKPDPAVNTTKDVNAYDLIASYVTLQATGGSAPQGTVPEVRVLVPAGATSVKFYVGCKNDYAAYKDLFKTNVNVLDPQNPAQRVAVPLGGLYFTAKRCAANNTIIGDGDECNLITPFVENRDPSIRNVSAPTKVATGAQASFTFTVADTASDYLVMIMEYGDGIQEAALLVDEGAMKKLRGDAAWEDEYETLVDLYGYTGADGQKTLPIVSRTIDTQSYTFKHAYESGTSQDWMFTVIDSSMGMATRNGTITLDASQHFIFKTIHNLTAPGSGYVLWDTGADVLTNWTFDTDSTRNSRSRSGETLLKVIAAPFSAGARQDTATATALGRFNGPSATHDSFFYMWDADEDFATILPSGEKAQYQRYEETLTFNRAYVKEGEATDPTKWQDIMLSAIFVAEYLPGDSIEAKLKDPQNPYMYELGDYNQDGVPDGWLLKHMGVDSRASLVESTTSVANNSPSGTEYLPYVGFGAGDGAYTFGNSTGALNGSCAAEAGATPFGYKLRIRGRHEALNAADGEGNWLSIPAWVVLVHPEHKDTPDTVNVGRVDIKGKYTPAWEKIELFSNNKSTQTNIITGKPVNVAYTVENKIPYDAETVDADGWAYVVDNSGNTIQAGAGRYRSNNVMVYVDDPTDVRYEQMKYFYKHWGADVEEYDATGELDAKWTPHSQEEGALFPFITKADATDAEGNTTPGSDSAMLGARVEEWSGAMFCGEYRFVDGRAIAGIYLDEPFRMRADSRGMIDPRLTSWLDRFAGQSADTDGDGIKNGAEYFFWYYASRIAYGSVFANKDGVQLNTDLWPAIDIRNRDHANPWNRDVRYRTVEKFTMGRRFRNDFDPDLQGEGAVYGDFEPIGTTLDGSTRYREGAVNPVSAGKGNYWEPIRVEDVMNAFDPFEVIDMDVYGDLDNDGILVVEELAVGSNPIDCDSDNDWIPDGWEILQGLDPLNGGDAELNPDEDYFAYAVVEEDRDYHHLFPMNLVSTDAEGNEVKTPHYYDFETKKVLRLTGLSANATVCDESNIAEVQDFTDEVKAKTEWLNENPLMMAVAGKLIRLRDHEVYRAFGFNPATALRDGMTQSFISYPKLSFAAVNTKKFSSREEFFSSHRNELLYPLNPLNADTNGDGVPDGWQLYVNLDPSNPRDLSGVEDYDADGMSVAQEFACAAGNLIAQDLRALEALDPGSLIPWGAQLTSDEYTNRWTNKILPTDPWNPDTDSDGILDLDEGRYTYGSPDWNALIGGGCNPNAMDTDGDGMSDTWECAYFVKPTPNFGTVSYNGETIGISGAPDPTITGFDGEFTEYDFDYDHDGLTNYQEYLVSTMRHLRYDLSPAAARLYKEDLGKRSETNSEISGKLEWIELPDLYSPTTDLVNPVAVRSIEFARKGTLIGDILTLEGAPFYVNPLGYGMAVSSRVENKTQYTQWKQQMMPGAADSITTAFNAIWASSIIFPSPTQLEAYELAEVKDGLENDHSFKIAQNRVLALESALLQLDASYRRMLVAANIDRLVNPAKDLDRDKAIRQIRGLVMNIDGLLKDLALDANAGNLGAILTEMLKDGGETQKLWAARKNQILVAVKAVAPTVAINTVYGEMTAISGVTYTDDLRNAFDNVVDEPKAYEEAVATSTNPLIQERYRNAIRGFNGGFNGETLRMMPTSWHSPVKSFRERKEKGTVFLGTPITEETVLGANKLPRDSRLPTTDPLVADTDHDGMDDYFEVFHGLNPLLGDIENSSHSAESMELDVIDAMIDFKQPRTSNANVCYQEIKHAGVNAFGNEALSNTSPTGYDYYAYPWMAGLPQADPDGDGLLNSEEAVNPVTSNPSHYGTDPSALWMTDATNTNSFVARFYGCQNANLVKAGLGAIDALPFVSKPNDNAPTAGESCQPYEINEGYDTDGDGISDLVELTSNGIFRGDPQTLRSPYRQQAAYFGGKGVLQTMEDTQFGPQMLTTFTVECWVKPEGVQATQDVILIDRPWRANDSEEATLEALRHNFVLGLRKKDGVDGLFPFTYYTGAGTTEMGTPVAVPQASPTVVAGKAIVKEANAEEWPWTHLAVTYDGARLVLYVNGVESGSDSCGLIPANGVYSVYIKEDVLRMTYRKAPIMVGATAAQTWFADLGDPEDNSTFETYFMNGFKGFIDEVRIWNGARTMAQIAEACSRNLTQTELLTMRLNAFTARKNGMGYYEANTPTEPLAIYTFNDLLAGKRTDGSTAGDSQSWERFPGDQLTGDATVPGSFMYRRKGFLATKKAIEGAVAAGTDHPLSACKFPEETDLFTSYYTLTAAKNLRSVQYAENREAEAPTLATGDAPISEFVPLAHNTVAHLPLADVQRDNDHNFAPVELKEGKSALKMPSGKAENLKVADSFYWSPYRAGDEVSTTPIYQVKTTGNPYVYRYHGTVFFDLQDYYTRPAFTTQVPTDLLVYGDVFAKYERETWDNSPSTDPSAGNKTNEGPAGADWFRHEDGKDAGSKLNDKQYSQGGYWLEQNIAAGQTKDTDGDRMPNWWENYYGLDSEDPEGINGPHGDQDGDFLTNYAEHLASANPLKYSTVGNGVPDYQIPMWFRRGAPTFGLLYTDNDFMEDHWEAKNRSEKLSVDSNDAAADPDNDGWSNWAEARANFRSGYHSTNPNAATTISQTGKIQLEMPTPALRMTVDYFGNQNVYTNATAEAKIVVHTYTAKNNNSAPDATFNLPLALTGGQGSDTIEYEIGAWKRGVMSGYFHIGNIKPGSLKIKFTRMAVDTPYEEDQTDEKDYGYFNILSDTTSVNDVAELYAMEEVSWVGGDGEQVGDGYARLKAGWVNYRTGEFTLDFSNTEDWPEQGSLQDDEGKITVYDRTEFVGVATYSYGVVPGQTNTFTLVNPDEGHVKEGPNNFFVFADLDGNGKWNDGEPAGVPDQHDVEIGFDQVNEVLHVALSEQAPAGAVRLDVDAILGVLLTENENNDVVAGDNSSIINPSTDAPLQPSLFATKQNYHLLLAAYERIGSTVATENPGAVVFQKPFNVKKPYLTEDDIFNNADTAGGLADLGGDLVAVSYKVYLLPETMAESSSWSEREPYNIAVVTNAFGTLDDASTAMVSPVGGVFVHNTELTFEWKSNIQVPQFDLIIRKTANGAGDAESKTVFNKTGIRGVTPSATAIGTGAVEQFVYRYKLPRGIGEINSEGTALFGDGSYSYELTLKPYCGKPKKMSGKFKIQLNASGDENLAELEGTTRDTSFNVQDSYYVRTRIRYNGVLRTPAEFGYRSLVVEAHYSGSFNGNPVASTTDVLVYDDTTDPELADFPKLNRCVKMVKDKTTKIMVAGEEKDEFFSTRFDVELRGLATNRPVYLLAYFDLNGNRKRDAWEPWGYATQGLDAVGGFYFDPLAVTPLSSGAAWNAEFYIQDVDTDNDKLADAWEWLQGGKKSDSFLPDGSTNSGWCNTFGGSLADFQQSAAIWTTDIDGNLALTSFGAQLYGLTVVGEPDENGAVKVEGVDDAAAAKELLDLLGNDVALNLIEQGVKSYGLTVNKISFNGDVITLNWAVTGAVGLDGDIYDLSALFAEGKNTSATYSVYGAATLGGTWTKLAEVKVAGEQTPAVEIPTSAAIINGTEQATFFKVILSATPMTESLD